ncbi:MAG: hypothetical protein ACJA04_000685 [Cellvibrionaceae bacterium]|jgi:hypothetical protein
MEGIYPPNHIDLVDTFIQKYGEVGELGSSPALRWKFDYFNPDDVYEALVDKLVGEEKTNCTVEY